MTQGFESIFPEDQRGYEEKKESKESFLGSELNDFLFRVEDIERKRLTVEEDQNNDFETRNDLAKLSETDKDFLEKSGLGLELRKYAYPRKYLKKESEEEFSERGVVINVKDKGKFLDYLKRFERKELSREEAISLEGLGAHFDYQIKNLYRFHKVDEDLLALISILKELSFQYERFSQITQSRDLKEGLEDISENFYDYDKASSGKYLREYLAIQKLESDYFYAFHADSLSIYKNFWDDFLDIIEKCVGNKNSHQFLKEKLDCFEENFLEHTEKLKYSKKEIIEHIEVFGDDFCKKFEEIKNKLS